MRLIINTMLATLIVGTVLSASAADVEIHLKGKIKAAACTVDNNGIYNVDLGQNISASTLKAAGSGADWVPFNITLSQCPVGTTVAIATFSGAPGDVAEHYANASGAGYAQNVDVELQQISGNLSAGNGQSLRKDVDDNTHTVTFDMQARAYSLAGNATAGDISSVVTVEFEYE